jgi:hypothetical protein
MSRAARWGCRVVPTFAATLAAAVGWIASAPGISGEERKAAPDGGAAEPARPGPLRAGFARFEITPARHRDLFGYGFRDDGNDGQLDRLHGRALVLVNGAEKPAVLISLDLAIVGTEWARNVRQAIADELHTDFARVILGAIHTHSSEEPRRRPLEELRPDLLDAARRAAGLTYPVRPFVREAPLGIAYNRRARGPDGKIKICWNPQEWPDRVPDPAPDPTCSVLLLRQENGPRQYVLWSVGAHPVVLGKTSRLLSADFPGRACDLIEAWLPDSRAVFAVGACGNTHPWIATQEDPKQIDSVARAAASFVTLLTQAAVPAQEETPVVLRAAQKALTIGKSEVDVTVWRLGRVWIVALPVELFQELALDLRKRLGGAVVVVTNANGYAGYWPHRQAFEEGAYEVETAKRGYDRKAGDGEALIDEVVKLAQTIRG